MTMTMIVISISIRIMIIVCHRPRMMPPFVQLCSAKARVKEQGEKEDRRKGTHYRPTSRIMPPLVQLCSAKEKSKGKRGHQEDLPVVGSFASRVLTFLCAASARGFVVSNVYNHVNYYCSDAYNHANLRNVHTPSPPIKIFPTKSPRVELSGRPPVQLYGYDISHPLEVRACLSQTL